MTTIPTTDNLVNAQDITRRINRPTKSFFNWLAKLSRQQGHPGWLGPAFTNGYAAGKQGRDEATINRRIAALEAVGDLVREVDASGYRTLRLIRQELYTLDTPKRRISRAKARTLRVWDYVPESVKNAYPIYSNALGNAYTDATTTPAPTDVPAPVVAPMDKPRQPAPERPVPASPPPPEPPAESVALLESVPVPAPVARSLARSWSPERIREVVTAYRAARGVRCAAAWIRAALSEGWTYKHPAGEPEAAVRSIVGVLRSDNERPVRVIRAPAGWELGRVVRT